MPPGALCPGGGGRGFLTQQATHPRVMGSVQGAMTIHIKKMKEIEVLKVESIVYGKYHLMKLVSSARVHLCAQVPQRRKMCHLSQLSVERP